MTKFLQVICAVTLLAAVSILRGAESEAQRKAREALRQKWMELEGQSPTAPPPAPAQVESQGPINQNVTAGGLVASGYVVARRQATVAAEVTGRVLEVRVEEGQQVRRGQVLAVLEPTLARAELGSARARRPQPAQQPQADPVAGTSWVVESCKPRAQSV